MNLNVKFGKDDFSEKLDALCFQFADTNVALLALLNQVHALSHDKSINIDDCEQCDSYLRLSTKNLTVLESFSENSAETHDLLEESKEFETPPLSTREARLLRFISVDAALNAKYLTRDDAIDLLSGCLNPDDASTLVDDSKYLDDPDALNKIINGE